ncbi:MAG TPA: hypothetical protein VJJ22_04815 [Candidatus Paceibacterota bacterium]
MTFEWANRRFQTLVAVYEGLRASLAPEASPIQTPDTPFPIDAGMGKHFGQENIPAINEMLSAGTWKSVPSTWWMTAWMDQLLLFALYERRREQLKSEKPEEFLLGEEDLTKGMLRVGALGADLARRYGPAGSMDDRGVSWSCVEKVTNPPGRATMGPEVRHAVLCLERKASNRFAVVDTIIRYRR